MQSPARARAAAPPVSAEARRPRMESVAAAPCIHAARTANARPRAAALRRKRSEMNTAARRTSAPPSSEALPVSGRALARDLLRMLGERRPEFLGFVKKRVRSGADAEDLLQQALVRAAEKIEGLRSDDRIDAWFYRVLRNTIADHRAAWATREAKLGELAREAIDATPDEAAICGCSMGVMEKLRPEYATMLRRVDIDEESIENVAASLHISTNNAKVRLHRARKALRDELLSWCGTDSVRACQDCACDDAISEGAIP